MIRYYVTGSGKDTAVIDDSRVTMQGFGLLVWLLPNDGESMIGLQDRFPDTVYTVQAALRELYRYGYITQREDNTDVSTDA